MDLLDVLSAKVGCLYLSDLKAMVHPERIRAALIHLEASDFSVHDWNDAVNYFVGSAGSFSTAEEAKLFLLSKLGC